MNITDYTSYNEIRATTGLSSDEVPDTELAMEIYANTLELALNDVDLTDDAPGPGPLTTRFITIAAIAEGSRTTLEQQLYNLTRLFSTYSVALEVVVSLSMKAPKTQTDSKASLVRFSPESAYKDVIARIERLVGDIKTKIEDIGESTTTVDIPLLTVVEPATDVVTGT